ncbi:MAG: ankyrin repeat domain-containing protein [Bacteroidales bacterium]
MVHVWSPHNYLVVLLAGALLFLPEKLPAQETEIDTSEYLPLFYSGALEFNLMKAASLGYASEVARMINQGAEIDAVTSEGGTALIFAVSGYHLNTVKVLLDNNADPNKITAKSETPLLIAVRSRMLYQTQLNSMNQFIDSVGMAIAETLIRHGADLNFQDMYGATPLNYASIYGYANFADMLIYYGADIDLKSYDGTTPLMAAIWAGNDDVAKLLVMNGANLESRDFEGNTPFLIAAQNGDTLMFGLLMRNGVDIYEKNNHDWDALDISIKSDQEAGTDWLIRKGDKWSDPARKVINYYDVAANYSRKEMLRLLEKNNFPSKYRPHFNQVDLSISSKFNLRDIYTGFNFAFKEPLKNIGVIAGFDTKLWYTRVLIRENPDIYYQYMDKSSIAYAGVLKDFKLTENLFKSNISLSASLSGAYFFGNKFKGTEMSPASKFKVIPATAIKFENKNSIFSSGIEFMTSSFYGIWPIWVRIGFAHKFYFDSARLPNKDIKWY